MLRSAPYTPNFESEHRMSAPESGPNTTNPSIAAERDLDAAMDMASASVLIVDDHEQNRELLQAYLEEIGCDTRLAADGIEALALIEEQQPDLILLDVMMPRMSGFQLCSKIKSNPETRDISIVMVTALSEVGDVERAVECGADDFLTKPVNKLELVTRVRSLLRVRLLKRELEKTLRQMKDMGRN